MLIAMQVITSKQSLACWLLYVATYRYTDCPAASGKTWSAGKYIDAKKETTNEREAPAHAARSDGCEKKQRSGGALA